MAKAIQVFFNKNKTDNQVLLDSYLVQHNAQESSNEILGDSRAVRYDTFLMDVDIHEVIDHVETEFPNFEVTIESVSDDDLALDLEPVVTIEE